MRVNVSGSNPPDLTIEPSSGNGNEDAAILGLIAKWAQIARGNWRFGIKSYTSCRDPQNLKCELTIGWVRDDGDGQPIQ